MKTKNFTEICMLIALSIVIKLLTDLITRSALFFLFIDPLLLFTVYIIYKNNTLKTAILLSVIQTVLSLSLFFSTDIWFVRPFTPFIAFFILNLLKNMKLNEKKKIVKTVFFTTYANIFVLMAILISILILIPNSFPLDSIEQTLSKFNLSEEVMKNYILISIGVFGLVYSLLPSLVNSFIMSVVLKIKSKYKGKHNN